MTKDQLETWMHNMIRACNRSTYDSDINVLKLIQHIENLYEKGRADEREQAEKQEPVAWMSQGGDVSRSKKHLEEMGFNFVIPLYTAPFNWVGIAVDEIPSLWGNADADLWLFAQAIEAKLKERNT
jgi:hypothetical protein